MLSLSLASLLRRRESPHNSAVKGFFDMSASVLESLLSDTGTFRSSGFVRLKCWIRSRHDLKSLPRPSLISECLWNTQNSASDVLTCTQGWKGEWLDCIKGYFADFCSCDSEQILSKCLEPILFEEKKFKAFSFYKSKGTFHNKKYFLKPTHTGIFHVALSC